VVTYQLQVERRTGKVRQSETDVLPLCHATNQAHTYAKIKIKGQLVQKTEWKQMDGQTDKTST